MTGDGSDLCGIHVRHVGRPGDGPRAGRALHVELHAWGVVVGAGSSRRVAARLAHAAVRERVCGATGRDAREETALPALHAQLLER